MPVADETLRRDSTSAPDPPPTLDGVAPPVGLTAGPPGRSVGFQVHLENFEGPFDLLLGLISKHKMDVTEIALARVTDEFVSWIRSRGSDWDLGEASEFLVIAATLLDLKAARLLPAAEVEDDEDLALLEARDLLFARLLQYRAFKDVAATFQTRLADEARRVPRAVGVEPQFARLLPELVLGVTPHQLAEIAARAMEPKVAPTVGLDHLHSPVVSVREQAALIVDRLRRTQVTSFRTLVADAGATSVVVARFLALLELFKEGFVAFDQAAALGELTIRWTGVEDLDVELDVERDLGLDDEFDASATSRAASAVPSRASSDEASTQTGEDGVRDPADDRD